MIPSIFRFFLFTLYLGILLFLPLSILWGTVGFVLAFLSWISFLLLLGWDAPHRISRSLSAREITRSEAPYLFHVTEELCRRAQLPLPKLWVFSAKVPNLATFGFSKTAAHILVTTEVLSLKRTEQMALIGRAIVTIAMNDCFNSTWLNRFLNLLDSLVQMSKGGQRSSIESDSLRHFLLQTILYPLSMVPLFLLGRTTDPFALDDQSLRISKQPLGLSEAYRKMELGLQTQLFQVPLSTYHLFLAEPKRQDMLTQILFKRRSLTLQIDGLNPLRSRI